MCRGGTIKHQRHEWVGFIKGDMCNLRCDEKLGLLKTGAIGVHTIFGCLKFEDLMGMRMLVPLCFLLLPSCRELIRGSFNIYPNNILQELIYNCIF